MTLIDMSQDRAKRIRELRRSRCQDLGGCAVLRLDRGPRRDLIAVSRVAAPVARRARSQEHAGRAAMKNLHLCGLLLVLTVVAPSVAPASPNAALRSACVADAKRLCGKVIGDPKARMACMRANRSKLSSRCRAAADKRRGEARAACRTRLLPKLKSQGRDKAVAAIRSCVQSEMQRR
jgi:hypothetical protein